MLQQRREQQPAVAALTTCTNRVVNIADANAAIAQSWKTEKMRSK